MGEKVYVGGRDTEEYEDRHHVFEYNTTQDEWSRLPPHPLIYFAMAHFTGNLITVGGEGAKGGIDITGRVYRFKEESQEWEEFLKPMRTARFLLTVATTQSAIIASGGVTDVRDGTDIPCATVEVYSSETSQWYTADPLPAPCSSMSSTTIADTYYLLLGWDADNKVVTTVLYASLTNLVQKATSPTRQSASRAPVWKTLPNTPLKMSAAASLSGRLLSVGGYNGEISKALLVVRVLASLVGFTVPVSPDIHVFLPLINSWVRVTYGDLPQPRFFCTVVQLSSNTIAVFGGIDDHYQKTKTVFMATIIV